MTIHPALLGVVADPLDHSGLGLSTEGGSLDNAVARRRYRIDEDIPVLLAAEATVLVGPVATPVPPSQFDGLSAWYDRAMAGDGERSLLAREGDDLLVELLGTGEGVVLDLGCGTGRTASLVRGLGWTPVGTDLSFDQLRIARTRLPVVQASAHGLPFRDGAFGVVYTTFTTASWGDLRGSLAEVARVLAPGGRAINIGVHPCFNGGHSERGEDGVVTVRPGYRQGGWLEPSHFPKNRIRSRTGGWHWPLADLLDAVAAAGLVLTRAAEVGPQDGAVPDVLALAATKPRLPVLSTHAR